MRSGSGPGAEAGPAKPDEAAPPLWPALGVVVAGYLAVTVAESALAPLFPTVARDLGLDLALAGVAFGVLTGGIAVGNLAGGALFRQGGEQRVISISLLVAAVGSGLAALATTKGAFLGSQVLVGLGAGVFFAPGISALGRAAGRRRRGLAMGMFGGAFSAGLAVAALLAAAGAEGQWRLTFWAAAAMCVAGLAVVVLFRLPGRSLAPTRPREGTALGFPVLIGAVGTVSQYGTVGFLALFATSAWGLSAAAAALLIAAGRVLSLPSKLVVGAAADRFGSAAVLRGVVILLVGTGAAWTLVPRSTLAFAAAAVFVAAVSGLFPIANLLAVEEFGEHGGLLGAYRSVQIGVGAAASWAIGAISQASGLRPTLAVASLLPALLLVVGRKSTRPHDTR